MQEGILEPRKSGLGVRHVLLVYTAPSILFKRVEDTGSYGWALVTLLGLVTLIGYLQVQTGLIDRLVDEQTEKRLAEVEVTQVNLVDRVELRRAMEAVRKNGVFLKLISRLQVILLSPIVLLASFLLIASVLFAVVALTGRKPEYHTLMAICVFSGFIELIAHALRVAMMVYYHSIEVDTSLRMLASGEGPTILAALDPFRFWFWILVGMGLTVTRQLSRRMAIASCLLLCLVTTGARVALEFGTGG